MNAAAHAAELAALRAAYAVAEHQPLTVVTPAGWPYARTMHTCTCGWLPTADRAEAYGWDTAEQFMEHAPASARLIPVAVVGDGYAAAGLDWHQWHDAHPDADPFAVEVHA